MQLKSRMVLALDVTDRERALKVAGEVGSIVDAIKVGYPLVLSCGLGIVTELSKKAHIICDFKVADIPNTNRLIAQQAFRAGARGIIMQAFTGRDSLAAIVDEARKASGDVFAVTEMSHPGALDFLAARGEDMARMAAECGAAGIIAPATRPDRVAALRTIVGKLLILSPGVGAQGGSASATIKAGADAVIVGRSIYESTAPAKAAGEIADEIKGVTK